MSRLTERLFGATTHARTHEEGEEHWISVSDLMAGLMMVFLFISIALMRSAFIERDKIKEVAITYQENQVALYNALIQAFHDDLPRWDADIEQATLSFQFKSPDVLFDTGQITLKPAFQAILNDFFPRYLNVLTQFRDSIDEVRIEGHTSSLWNHRSTPEEAYFNNMALSQGRTRAVLEYVYTLPTVAVERPWIKKHLAAVGFSSSRLIQNPDGAENVERSRRVSFRVMTNAETQIRKILER